MKTKPFIIIILVFLIIKSLVWLFTIPIFQAPDEAVHFGYTQRIAELGSRGNPRRDGIISQELLEAATIMNFNWGKEHPVWQNYQTNWWNKLSQISFNNRKKFISINEQRGLKNPPLYYLLSTLFYKLVYPAGFVYRFFILRFFSVLIFLAIILLVYKTSLLVFVKKSAALAITALVAFQPMFSFQAVTINNDILAILAGTFFAYLGVKAIKEKKKKIYFFLFLIILGNLFIKPQLILFLFVFPLVLGKNFLKGLLAVFLATLVIIGIGWLTFDIYKISFNTIFLDKIRYQIAFNDYKESLFLFFNYIKDGSLFSKIGEYFSNNKETYLNNLFPWYWGVFGWLEVTMPLTIYRILKIIIIFSFFGLIAWFVKNFKNRKKDSFQIMFFLIWTIIIFSLGIIFNDFKVFSDSGKNFGIQGRYFLPVIAPQMIILVLGLKSLLPEKYVKWLYIFLIIGSLILNLVGYWTMYKYFYA